MTPLQKGMAKAYFMWFIILGMQAAVGLYLHWSDVGGKDFYIIMWTCMPIMFAYNYYLRNRENKSVSPWIDTLKLFMVCFVIFFAYFISIDNTNGSEWLGPYFSILLSVILAATLASKYLWDMKQNKK